MFDQEKPAKKNISTCKANFIRSEQQNLQSTIKDLTSSLHLNRRTIIELVNGCSTDPDLKQSHYASALKNLTEQNQQLQCKIFSLIEQNRKMRCQLLLHDQIVEQLNMQRDDVITKYQEKIIELRRLLQSKQFQMQARENAPKQANMDYLAQEELTVPFCKNMGNFVDFSQLRNMSEALSEKNKALQHQVSQLNQVIHQLTQKNDRLGLILKSAVSYQSAKDLLKNSKRYYSLQKLLPKRNVKTINYNLTSSIKQREPFRSMQRNRQKDKTAQAMVSDQECLFKLRYLYFKERETNKILRDKLKEADRCQKATVNSNKLLIQSNISYQRRKKVLQAQLRDLTRQYNLLLKRQPCRLIQRSMSQSGTQKVFIPVASLKQTNPKQERRLLTNQLRQSQPQVRMNYISIMKNSFKNPNRDSERIRSRSCILDYYIQTHPQVQGQPQQALGSALNLYPTGSKPFIAPFTKILLEAPIDRSMRIMGYSRNNLFDCVFNPN